MELFMAPFGRTFATQSKPNIDLWVSEHFRWSYCNHDGRVVAGVSLKSLRKRLVKLRPQDSKEIVASVAAFAKQNGIPSGKVVKAKSVKRTFDPKPKIQPNSQLPGSATQTEEQEPASIFSKLITFFKPATQGSQSISVEKPEPILPAGADPLKDDKKTRKAERKAEREAFKVSTSSITNSNVVNEVQPEKITIQPDNIPAASPETQRAQVGTSSISNSNVIKEAQPEKITIRPDNIPAISPEPQSAQITEGAYNPNSTKNGVLAKKLRQLQIQPEKAENHNSDHVSTSSVSDRTEVNEPENDLMDLLRTDAVANKANPGDVGSREHEVRYTPIISGKILDQFGGSLLPQYGYLGDINESAGRSSRLFLNTNTPFSAMVFGVQGSGKSHTTSCLLETENALIPSRHLGRLQEPLSALVFSYGDYGGGGAGFTVSEAAFLASRSRNPKLQDHPVVKKITVLTSPTNPNIRDDYNQLENVTAIPFKLKLHTLDAGMMSTLMSFDESNKVPLYMAEVQKIIRDLATERKFHYFEFKRQLKRCKFNSTQESMLELRLGLLESFLDLKNECPMPTFEQGEITIMDLSCPFVDTNTACILFNLGLKQYMQSPASGKIVVLDEAHKSQNRHPPTTPLRARMIVSTQEPGLLADLIALSSITIMHRFSSPEWFSALKKHIPMDVLEENRLMGKIEKLRTGAALIYSPNAVLDIDEDGNLVKSTSKLLETHIRRRVTADGGQSILSVD
ncbi:AAA-like domain protein [Rutstroemia sp. NJR-2017a BVV2]|nr:AAA-like domain protein [Rutstroemia sp. NJR-2017a BVV2]